MTTYPRQMWTAYPFAELGDPARKHAPVREVTALSYDGNKYVRVRLPDGQETWVKSGYLYETMDECLNEEFGR